MKLILKVGNELNNDVYFSNNIIAVCTSNGNNIFSPINNKRVREDYISSLEEEISFDKSCKKTNEQIIRFIKTRDENIKLSDFDDVVVEFTEDISPLELRKFFESVNSRITIKAENLSNDNIIAFKKIKFKKEPLIVTSYNKESKAPLDEIINSLEIVDNMKLFISKFDLSPLEQLMLLYDLLKERIYKASDSDDKSISRDLNKVLSGDEIVCAGYSNIFAAVANALGIKSQNKYYFKDKSGHATAISFISDDKYDYHGVLEFDPTWDSKKNDNDDFINNYNWFGLNIDYANEQKKKFSLINNDEETIGSLGRSISAYKQITESFGVNDEISKGFVKNMLRHMNTFFSSIEDKRGLALLDEYYSNKEDLSDAEVRGIFDELIDEASKARNRLLSYEDFNKVIYQTRKVEHYISPQKYPFEADILKKISNNKFARQRLFYSLFMPQNSEKRHLKETKKGQKVFDNGEIDEKRMELLYVLNEGLKQEENKSKHI
jgi:hypothetical protein